MDRRSKALSGPVAAGLTADAPLVDAARAFAAAATAPRTRDAYRLAWSSFASWCASKDACALPAQPETVALYIAHRARDGRKPATIELDLAAISAAHKAAGLPSPRSSAAVRAVRAGVRRSLGVAQRRAAPLLPADLIAISRSLPDSLPGKRDRALLLLGFAIAARRSELVALEVEDLAFVPQGLEVTIRRSKTDQEGRGEKLAVPRETLAIGCPVRALEAWLAAAGIEAGPVFRNVTRHGNVAAEALAGHSISRIVKARAVAAGIDPTRVSGHSLRAGFVTAGVGAGRSDHEIVIQTRHRDTKMVGIYRREVDRWDRPPGRGLLSGGDHGTNL